MREILKAAKCIARRWRKDQKQFVHSLCIFHPYRKRPDRRFFPMHLKVFIGGLLSLLHNAFVGKIPLPWMRRLYLRLWLDGLGAGTRVQMGCRFLNGRKVHLGERNVINFGCLLDGRKFHIRTGSDVSIGPEASLLTLGHDPQSPDFSDQGGDVIIGNRVWIGYRSIILPGVAIGEGAVVGAGAIVTKDVEPFTIVAGNPARKIGERSREIAYELRFDSLFL